KAEDALLADLEDAKKETRFSESIEKVKHGLPGALLIDGENPLTLLHNALSDGVHARSDSECLELATAIRRVLAEFAERMAVVLTEDKDLKSAVNKLRAVRRSEPSA